MIFNWFNTQKCKIYGHLEFFLFYFTSLPQKLIIEKYNYMYIEAPLNLSVIKSYYSLMILLYRYPLIPLDDIFWLSIFLWMEYLTLPTST
jgi:hypothetical protein